MLLSAPENAKEALVRGDMAKLHGGQLSSMDLTEVICGGEAPRHIRKETFFFQLGIFTVKQA